MIDLSRIYEPWSGVAEAMAADIGEKGVTCRQWRNRGKIPQEYWPAIIEKSAERGDPITAADLLNAHFERAAQAAAA